MLLCYETIGGPAMRFGRLPISRFASSFFAVLEASKGCCQQQTSRRVWLKRISRDRALYHLNCKARFSGLWLMIQEERADDSTGLSIVKLLATSKSRSACHHPHQH